MLQLSSIHVLNLYIHGLGNPPALDKGDIADVSTATSLSLPTPNKSQDSLLRPSTPTVEIFCENSRALL